jgi:hypothetical protein
MKIDGYSWLSIDIEQIWTLILAESGDIFVKMKLINKTLPPNNCARPTARPTIPHHQ